jgi:hypothetical protein
MPSKKDIYGN